MALKIGELNFKTEKRPEESESSNFSIVGIVIVELYVVKVVGSRISKTGN
jgi:hypothetical protein